ncbi:FAD/NAD(P)-binding domain-containing protein [Xylariaceae sp. FL1019]|nr:FAD/NAD(P)-binding domain-containing protein [Xylariaceae sp. FL1019]
MPLKILIIGAGVCGPALATLLTRADPHHSITIIERSPTLRKSGLQIDLRAHGVPIVQKMGLMDALRKRVVQEGGLAVMNENGGEVGTFGKFEGGTGQQSMVSEFELMRSDIVDVFYRASLGLSTDRPADGTEEELPTSAGNVRYEFGVTVESFAQHDAHSVVVKFSDGRMEKYDMLIGADGQGSRTRRALLGKEKSDACFKSLDMFIAYFTVPRNEKDDDMMRIYNVTGKRTVSIRSGDPKAPTQVYMSVMTSKGGNERGMRTGVHQSGPEQQDLFVKAFEDEHGWRVDEFRDRLMKDEVPEGNFYAQEIGQVKCDTLAVGRVALLGDAGYTPSPVTGMGTTLSLIGAYILAGEISKHGSDVQAGLQSYAKVVQPYVAEGQKLLPGGPRILHLETRWAIALLHSVVWFVSRSGLADLIGWVLVKFMPEGKIGLKLPEYPGLKL